LLAEGPMNKMPALSVMAAAIRVAVPDDVAPCP
jgi:hypothetical protein